MWLQKIRAEETMQMKEQLIVKGLWEFTSEASQSKDVYLQQL